MYRKLMILPLVALLGSLPLHAGQVSVEQAATQVVRAAAAVAGKITEETPYAKYKRGVAEVTEPTYEALRPLLKELSAFNTYFEVASEEDGARIAAVLNEPVQVGWNNYRPVPLKEILDSYLPQENQDADVAALEYYMHLNLLSAAQRESIEVFEDLGNKEMKQFRKTYQKFVSNLEGMPSYDANALTKEYLKVIHAYNKLNETLPSATKFVKSSAFINPIKGGWGRTVTVAQLRRDLAENKVLGGGDGVTFYTAKQLQQRYDISDAETEMLLRFVKEYYKK